MAKKKFQSYREGSKANWGDDLCPTQTLTRDQIQLGAILRIADAIELMARRHTDLINERDRYKRSAKLAGDYNQIYRRRIAGLRGQITRLKKQTKKC